MGRKVLAVVVGYLVVAVLTMATFAVAFPGALRAMGEGREPPPPGTAATLGLLAAGVLAGLAGGAVAGRVGGRGAGDGRLLGAVMTLLGLVSMAMNWGRQPLWFQVGLIAIAFPSAAVGGALAGRRGRPRAAAGGGP